MRRKCHEDTTPDFVWASLVHLPNKDWVTRAAAQKVAATGSIVLGTIGFGAPVFGVFANDNNARFRDGKSYCTDTGYEPRAGLEHEPSSISRLPGHPTI